MEPEDRFITSFNMTVGIDYIELTMRKFYCVLIKGETMKHNMDNLKEWWKTMKLKLWINEDLVTMSMMLWIVLVLALVMIKEIS